MVVVVGASLRSDCDDGSLMSALLNLKFYIRKTGFKFENLFVLRDLRYF
jgi:hypothetical protein